MAHAIVGLNYLGIFAASCSESPPGDRIKRESGESPEQSRCCKPIRICPIKATAQKVGRRTERVSQKTCKTCDSYAAAILEERISGIAEKAFSPHSIPLLLRLLPGFSNLFYFTTMGKNKCLFLAVLMGLATVSCQNDGENANEYTLDAYGLLTEPESVFLGTDTTKVAGYYYAQDITIGEFVVAHSFGAWGFGEGFTYSNCTDDTTPGYNNMSAITKKGVKGDTYFISNAGGWDTPARISFKDGKAYKAIECFVTNSTYAYLALNGNDGVGVAKTDWGKDDWFKLTVTGFNGDSETGKVEFLLADGLNIVDSWQQIDLRKLGMVTRIVFTLSSTDNGDWGMNTPCYFCLDRLTVSE